MPIGFGTKHKGVRFHFQYTCDYPEQPRREVNIELKDDADLDTLLESFKQFLQACGFSVSGDLEIVQPAGSAS